MAAAFLFLFLHPGMAQMARAQDSQVSADTWQNELLAWRGQHASGLQKPDGWLSLAGLEWLQPGENSFGSDSGNRIVLKTAGAPRLGILSLDGETVQLLSPPDGFPASFLVDGQAAKRQILRTDNGSDKNAPHLASGTLNMYVIRRATRFALRIKDSRSEALQTFHPLQWYPPDSHFRVTAKWIPYHPAKSISLETVAGTKYTQPVPGVAEFMLDGHSYRLEPVVEEGAPEKLFFILRDSTSSSETYPACRFLYTGLPTHGAGQPGELVLDFNRLENPPCAYTAFSTCPLPPPGNRLAAALAAGERRYRSVTGEKP